MSQVRVGLVLVGAGMSERMRGIDKVWADVAGTPVVLHSFRRFIPHVYAAVLVVHRDSLPRAVALTSDYPTTEVVQGGATRQESVWNGLRALPPVDVIAVHDVARPLAPLELLHEGTRLVNCTEAIGAVPAIAIADTIKQIDGNKTVTASIDRTSLRAVQTPQVFRAPELIAAHSAAVRGGALSATDDATLLEGRGEQVVIFDGARSNIKITTAFDLRLAEFLLAQPVPA